MQFTETQTATSEANAARFRHWWLVGLLIGGVTLALVYLAHTNGRPITSALVAVFGVVAIGALMGLRAGAFAGIVASLTFNIVFTDPTWTFTYSTADDLVPMIALTFSAMGAGLIAGRLRDRAIAAETASRRVAELLRFSQDLQRAIALPQVEATARDYLERQDVQLFVERDGELASHESEPWGIKAADELWHSKFPELTCDAQTAFLLKSADRRIGVLVARSHDGGLNTDEIRTFIPLITLAIQRCLLAEQLSDSDVVRRSEQFKTALLSSVSHDLRTPLAAISASAGSLADLREQLDEETQAELLATILEQCTRLDRFTTKLLSLGRIEGGLDVNVMPIVDAVEVLGGTISRVRPITGGRTIHRSFCTRSAPVRADESLLEQVFLNVLENAVAHTPKDASIRISAETTARELLIAVEDDGPGIAVADRERVFERFYQAGGAGSGSGLGLSIAKGFTELVGGTIIAASATVPMRGARIEVALPLATQHS
jgi:two-component system sensor histidine kinase KdpD